jgi:hypothetical protein
MPVMTDCTIWLNQYDLQSNVNEFSVSAEIDVVDATSFASGGWREFKPGLRRATAAVKGFFDPALFEAVASSLIASNVLLGVSVTGQAGSAAYIARGLEHKAGLPAKLGEMAMLETELTTSAPEGVVRGSVLLPKATATASGNSSGQQLGSVSTGQKIHAALFCFAASGTSPSLSVKVQSDDNAGFSSPTDRVMFSPFTATGYEMAATAGAISDNYWRVSWSISGTSPSFTFAVLAGIQ